uniref:Uncharacterized protein n=1 Tax=Solanum lycopersicum TaxID=4081 RepID=K4BSN3_SOLLC
MSLPDYFWKMNNNKDHQALRVGGHENFAKKVLSSTLYYNDSRFHYNIILLYTFLKFF